MVVYELGSYMTAERQTGNAWTTHGTDTGPGYGELRLGLLCPLLLET